MLIIVLPLIVCLVGLVMWGWRTPSPKPWAEIGKIMFAVGLFITVWFAAGHVVKLL
jgi:hypothetical protein